MTAQGNGGRGSRHEIGALPASGAEKWARKGGRKKKRGFPARGVSGPSLGILAGLAGLPTRYPVKNILGELLAVASKRAKP